MEDTAVRVRKEKAPESIREEDHTNSYGHTGFNSGGAYRAAYGSYNNAHAKLRILQQKTRKRRKGQRKEYKTTSTTTCNNQSNSTKPQDALY
eukprot:6155026-Amphidinium_carterae.1